MVVVSEIQTRNNAGKSNRHLQPTHKITSQAIQDRQKGELVAVLGSVFTVGEALSALESERGQV